MKHIFLSIVLVCAANLILSQSPMKTHVNKPVENPQPFFPALAIPSMKCDARIATQLVPNQNSLLSKSTIDVQSFHVTTSGSLWIEFKQNNQLAERQSIHSLMASVLPASVFEKDWSLTWEKQSQSKDEANNTHVRIRQTLAGHPILRQDMILHFLDEQLRDMNGFAWTGATPEKLPLPGPAENALASAKLYLQEKGINFVQIKSLGDGFIHEDKINLCWLPNAGSLRLIYEIEMHPNLMDRWTLFVDAGSMEVVNAYSQLCTLYPHQVYGKKSNCENELHENENHGSENSHVTSTLLDGPTTITDQDLLGQSRTVNGYQVNSTFFMIDASRGTMFNPTQSVMPNEPLGVIWTIDGQNGSPQKDNFEVIHVSNANNNWDPLEVSAHFNAGTSFEYFRQKFNRVSLNGEGGNIISIINIRDENGNDLDNAFWSGTAMFYGNGNTDFQPLAKGLDVAGHEMSHGVIQNTANLEYMGQSGALNESYADVFGSLIDRDDWRLGEDVVNLSAFPSGALRDLSNPHNGGNNLGDNGWQPQHMNEYQNLPNTPEGDNGGVHVNSGIPNKAYFLFASNIGKDKAEQIYYKALRDYLVKSSQFIDMRNAIEKAATDLHGANSPEVIAARSAFDGVGIGAGTGDDHQDDIEMNAGADFILATDGPESDLYWIPPSNPDQFVKLEVPAPLSRPSFTDDGTAAVYVDQENNMILLSFDWSAGLSYQAFYLEDNPQGIWRNVIVSKDGSKIAYTTVDLTNEIGIFDYDSEQSFTYFLFNPTTAEGIITGDVLYADAMEWDYSGEYIMYDALNRIESNFGDGIEYWDISFLRSWNNNANTFGDGQVSKLFTSLPESVSIGNPSFAKNSPYIITFDYLEDYIDQFGQLQSAYWILANNIETGVVNEIFENTTVGYPSYSRQDDRILFTYDDAGTVLLATINIQPGDKTLPVPGTDEVLITGAQKGIWFLTGNRDFTSSDNTVVNNADMILFPQPASDVLFVRNDVFQPENYNISDLSGKVLKVGSFQKSMINVSDLSPGLYFLQVKTDKQEFTSKFVKQ